MKGLKKPCALLLCLIVMTVGLLPTASAAGDRIYVDPSRFMCSSLVLDRGTISEGEDGAVAVAFRGGAPTITLNEPESVWAEGCNALCIDIKNSSNCRVLTLSYRLDGTEHQTQVSITRYGDRQTYYIYPERLEGMSDIQLSATGATTGVLELYGIRPVCLYDDSASQPGALLACEYDLETQRVRVSGRIDHEIAVDTRNATVELYAFSAEVNVTKALISKAAPIGSLPLSVRFEFEVPTTYETDRFLQYVVAIISPEGRVLHTYLPRFASAVVPEMDMDSLPIKGVHTEYGVLANRSGMELAIVDVYLDSMQSPRNNGILHISEGEYFYIDRAYITRLDGEIRRYSEDGCRVYLRFLSQTSQNGFGTVENPEAVYYSLSAEDSRQRRALFAYAGFLYSRYNGGEYGEAVGLVLGRAADRADCYNYSNADDLIQYTRQYAGVLYTLLEGAKESGRSVDIVVPVEARADVFGNGASNAYGYPPELFLASLCKYMDAHYGSALAVRVMLEDDMLPWVLGGEYMANSAIPSLRSAIERLSAEYQCVRGNYLYYWSPEAGIEGEALAASYAYIYYRFVTDQGDTVIFSTERMDKDASVSEVFEAAAYIDTALGRENNRALAGALGAQAWEALIPDINWQTMIRRDVFQFENHKAQTEGLLGSYVLWDPIVGRGTRGWYAGSKAALTLADAPEGGQMLVASFAAAETPLGISELSYSHFAKRIMSVTDMLSADVMIRGEAGQQYQVIFEICSDTAVSRVSAVVESERATTLYLNTQALNESHTIKSIRVFVSPSEGRMPYQVCIERLTAHSRSLDDKALSSAMEDARAQETVSESRRLSDTRWRAGVLLIVLSLGVGAMVIIALSRRMNGVDNE